MLDSTVVLATAARVTDRITIGFGVMLLALRPVAWAAKRSAPCSTCPVTGSCWVWAPVTPRTGTSGGARRVCRTGTAACATTRAGVLPALVTGQAAVLGDGLEVMLAPGSVMPPVLVAGNGDKALRRAAAYGDGWVCIGLPPGDVASGRTAPGGLAAAQSRPSATRERGWPWR